MRVGNCRVDLLDSKPKGKFDELSKDYGSTCNPLRMGRSKQDSSSSD